MELDYVRLICYFNGKLTDEDRDAKYIGGITKGEKVPKGIGFAIFKEKIREMMNLPVNGMEFKIKCALRLDELTVICIDVDDDKSLRFVMDDSTFVRAYIQHVPHATTSNSTQREKMLFPLEAFSSGACNEHQAVEAIPDKVKFDGSCGAEAVRLQDNHDRVDSSQLTMVNLVLGTTAIENQTKDLIDVTNKINPIEMNKVGVNPADDDGMNTNKDASSTETDLKLWFPEKLLPFISGYDNPSGDGNCGFGALCMALGREEFEWSWMRAELVKEIVSNKEFYNRLFGIEETDTLLKRTSHTQGSARHPNWMDMPSTGFVFAQAFKVVLVHYSVKNCWTFVPSLSPPSSDNVKFLGIGFVENNHYIKLDFQQGCPLPPFPHIPSKWRTINPLITNIWEELLSPRLLAFRKMNVPELKLMNIPQRRLL